MSWHYSQALVEEFSEANSLAGERSAPWKSNPTHEVFSSNARMTESLIRSLSGMTSKPSTESPGEDTSMSSAVGSPAKTSVAPGRVKALTENEAAYGVKWQESLMRYDHDSSMWKTHQCLLPEDLPWSSLTLPSWGMTRSGVLSEPTTAAHLTDAAECGSWRQKNQAKPQEEPTTGGYVEDVTMKSLADAGVTMENGSVWIAANGHTRSIMKCGTVANGAAPSMWLTPQANEDACGTPKGKMQKMLGNHPLIRGVEKDQWDTGTLNPTWVEWLMGWPIGWTDLKPLEMDKFQQWLDSHGKP